MNIYVDVLSSTCPYYISSARHTLTFFFLTIPKCCIYIFIQYLRNLRISYLAIRRPSRATVMHMYLKIYKIFSQQQITVRDHEASNMNRPGEF